MLLLALSLILTAFFSGMEIAFISANKLRYELDKQTNNFSSFFLNILFQRPQQFVDSLTVGYILSLVCFAFQLINTSSAHLSHIIPSPLFIFFLQILLCSFIVLLIGEFLPKALFKINANHWLNIFAFPLWCCFVLLYPFSKITQLFSKGLTKILGLKYNPDLDKKSATRNELDLWVQENIENSTDEEQLEHEVKIFQNALDFSNVKIKDCMVPRTEIVALEKGVDVEELKSRFTETGFSKIVIYQKDIDHILGYIHSSEMFAHANSWRNHIKTMPIVPETMPANKLLSQLMLQKKSMALVVDEFGGCSGIITLEDVMEEIFGEIEDEHDNNKLISKKISENEFILSARLEIDFLNQEFDLNLPESDEYLSLAGYILYHYQNFPKLNEIVKIDNYEIKILRVSNNKIELVNLKKK